MDTLNGYQLPNPSSNTYNPMPISNTPVNALGQTLPSNSSSSGYYNNMGSVSPLASGSLGQHLGGVIYNIGQKATKRSCETIAEGDTFPKRPKKSMTAPSAVVSSPITLVTAEIPTPPNWLENVEDTFMSLHTYKTYAICPTTAEYDTLANMVYPIAVTGIEQIVNPDLWERFVKTRTEMMRGKSDDLKILQELGLSEREVMRCAHLSLNFDRHPLIIPYSDNMVLLFHCTRSAANHKSILSQGLDERLCASGGVLGKGIYFVDDPSKSLEYDGTGYIFVFAVLLGDCISVDHFADQRGFVREPEKVKQQMRNFNDQFFDSLVARPVGHNEYVIFNGYQCCPIYQIKYNRDVVAGPGKTNCNLASLKLPPLAWLPQGSNYALPIQDQSVNWPFFAVDLFASMGVAPPTDDDDEEIGQSLDDNDIADNATVDVSDISEASTETPTSTDNSLPTEPSNEEAIVAVDDLEPNYQAPATKLIFNNSIDTVDLLDTSDSNSSCFIVDTKEMAGRNAVNVPSQTETCPICRDDLESHDTSPSSWQFLDCKHKVCLTCFPKLVTIRVTMSDVGHVFVKCPICAYCTGSEVGTCPDMQMIVSTLPAPCGGYSPSPTICINYTGRNFHRIAYLPDTDDGRKVLKLLEVAFDRRLCFALDTSYSTGPQNAIVWNIHHKTAISGGVSSRGYPDPQYLDRVREELKAYGIE